MTQAVFVGFLLLHVSPVGKILLTFVFSHLCLGIFTTKTHIESWEFKGTRHPKCEKHNLRGYETHHPLVRLGEAPSKQKAILGEFW